MHVVLGIDLTGIFKFDTSYMSTWSLQWAMLHRDFHMTSMSGIADIQESRQASKRAWTYKEDKAGDCV